MKIGASYAKYAMLIIGVFGFNVLLWMPPILAILIQPPPVIHEYTFQNVEFLKVNSRSFDGDTVMVISKKNGTGNPFTVKTYATEIATEMNGVRLFDNSPKRWWYIIMLGELFILTCLLVFATPGLMTQIVLSNLVMTGIACGALYYILIKPFLL